MGDCSIVRVPASTAVANPRARACAVAISDCGCLPGSGRGAPCLSCRARLRLRQSGHEVVPGRTSQRPMQGSAAVRSIVPDDGSNATRLAFTGPPGLATCEASVVPRWPHLRPRLGACAVAVTQTSGEDGKDAPEGEARGAGEVRPEEVCESKLCEPPPRSSHANTSLQEGTVWRRELWET